MIYVAASAYGRIGPMAGEAGIDPTVQSFCGWCGITGPEHGRGEMFRHLAHLDLTTATTITQAVLQALIARERTGRGQRIEIEMLTAAMALQTTRLAEYFATGEQPAPLGSAAATTAPHQAFKCEDHRYLAIGVERDEQWPGFCRAMKLDELISDPRFATNRDESRASRGVDPDPCGALQDQAGGVVDDPSEQGGSTQRTVPDASRSCGIILRFSPMATSSKSIRRIGAGCMSMACRGNSSARRRVRFARAASRASIPMRYSGNSAFWMIVASACRNE